MARQRLEQPYSSYDPDSGTLHQSTHAPGQGGSSGMAINMLSRGTGATPMALPSRYISTAPSQLQGTWISPGAYDQGNRIAQANRAAYEGAMGEQGRARDLEEREWNRRMLTEDRGYGMERERMGLDRERFGLESELSRGRLGMQGGLANALAQALGQRQQFGGAMDIPPWMTPQNGQARSQYGQGLDMRKPTQNYLMRFLKG